MTAPSNNNTTASVTYLESVKVAGKTYLESVMAHESAETGTTLKVADMTPTQLQRAFRARLRHEVAAIRKDRKIALKSDLQRIEARHAMEAGHSVNYATELALKINQRKLAEPVLLQEAIAAQTANNAERMSAEMAKKYDFASIVGDVNPEEGEADCVMQVPEMRETA